MGTWCTYAVEKARADRNSANWTASLEKKVGQLEHERDTLRAEVTRLTKIAASEVRHEECVPRAEIERLRELVQAAYYEGFEDGKNPTSFLEEGWFEFDDANSYWR